MIVVIPPLDVKYRGKPWIDNDTFSDNACELREYSNNNNETKTNNDLDNGNKNLDFGKGFLDKNHPQKTSIKSIPFLTDFCSYFYETSQSLG